MVKKHEKKGLLHQKPHFYPTKLWRIKKVPILTERYATMVQLAGIEPVRVTPLDPKSSASASSAIAADIEMVPSIGLEPITYRLQGGCSAS